MSDSNDPLLLTIFPLKLSDEGSSHHYWEGSKTEVEAEFLYSATYIICREQRHGIMWLSSRESSPKNLRASVFCPSSRPPGNPGNC